MGLSNMLGMTPRGRMPDMGGRCVASRAALLLRRRRGFTPSSALEEEAPLDRGWKKLRKSGRGSARRFAMSPSNNAPSCRSSGAWREAMTIPASAGGDIPLLGTPDPITKGPIGKPPARWRRGGPRSTTRASQPSPAGKATGKGAGAPPSSGPGDHN